MNVVFTMTLPQSIRSKPRPGEIAPIDEESIMLPFQNIYAAVDAKSLKDLLQLLHEK